MIVRLSPAAFEHRRALDRAWCIGAISTPVYAWLWMSLWHHGQHWRWN
jgi:hypothetical protein